MNQPSIDLLDLLVLFKPRCGDDIDNLRIRIRFKDGTKIDYDRNIYGEYLIWEQTGMASPMLQSRVISIKNKLIIDRTEQSINYKSISVIEIESELVLENDKRQ